MSASIWGKQRRQVRERGSRVLRLQGEPLFAIDPHHVLLPRDESRFDDRLVTRVGLDGGDIDAFVREQPPEPRGVLAIAGDAHDPRVFREFREVARDVGRTAGEPFLPHHLDNRHRRFGRNARDFSPEKFIEHEVSDDEETLTGKGFEECGKAGAEHAARGAIPEKRAPPVNADQSWDSSGVCAVWSGFSTSVLCFRFSRVDADRLLEVALERCAFVPRQTAGRAR